MELFHMSTDEVQVPIRCTNSVQIFQQPVWHEVATLQGMCRLRCTSARISSSMRYASLVAGKSRMPA